MPDETPRQHPRDPLHGVTLEQIVRTLVERHGWAEMAERIPVRCFQYEPSVKSSLTFLRKTPWARERLEGWYAWEAKEMAKREAALQAAAERRAAAAAREAEQKDCAEASGDDGAAGD